MGSARRLALRAEKQVLRFAEDDKPFGETNHRKSSASRSVMEHRTVGRVFRGSVVNDFLF
jgi:hypothetical protein